MLMFSIIQSLLSGAVVIAIFVGIAYLIWKSWYGIVILLAILMGILVVWLVGEYALMIMGVHPYPVHWHGCFMGFC